ncbi:ribosome biogenesis GTPase Der [Patescibacteria group bacterium]|nr:ribosome biogenesis GTPase Der [Patescibacteria group bacterium]
MFKIALIGQTNVGKSTLFNRLISESKAITSVLPGTTRDRNYGLCSWRGEDITFIDTGGIDEKTEDFKEEVLRHIKIAIKEADFLFFILEIRPPEVPISHLEQEISRLIKQSRKKCFVVLNKADNPRKRKWGESQHWLKMGFDQSFSVSALNGSGVGDLLDEVVNEMKKVKKLEEDSLEEREVPLIKVAILGKPNVGKSTLLNALLGEEKAIVSPLAHTTRGPQDSLVLKDNHQFLLIDTAGIRRRARIKLSIEKEGVHRSLVSVAQADVVLMVLDVASSLSHQDKALTDLIISKEKGLIFVLNKCDLISQQKFKRNDFVLELGSWAPAAFISAKNNKNVQDIFKLIVRVWQNCSRRIEEEKLNNFLRLLVKRKGFSVKVWDRVRIYQTGVNPPQFTLFVPNIIFKRKSINDAQINIIKKALRNRWDFSGAPLKVKIIKRT